MLKCKKWGNFEHESQYFYCPKRHGFIGCAGMRAIIYCIQILNIQTRGQTHPTQSLLQIQLIKSQRDRAVHVINGHAPCPEVGQGGEANTGMDLAAGHVSALKHALQPQLQHSTISHFRDNITASPSPCGYHSPTTTPYRNRTSTHKNTVIVGLLILLSFLL